MQMQKLKSIDKGKFVIYKRKVHNFTWFRRYLFYKTYTTQHIHHFFHIYDIEHLMLLKGSLRTILRVRNSNSWSLVFIFERISKIFLRKKQFESFKLEITTFLHFFKGFSKIYFKICFYTKTITFFIVLNKDNIIIKNIYSSFIYFFLISNIFAKFLSLPRWCLSALC